MNLFSFIKNKDIQNDRTGLSVSLRELIDIQRFIPYINTTDKLLTSNMTGNVKSAFKGRGIELEEVREYAYGDDVRDMDWRVTARKSEPYIKVYNEEKDREIVVLLDLTASMVFGTKRELKSVTAAKIAALLGWLSIKNKDRFGVLIYDGQNISYFKPQNNMKNLVSIFSKISQKTTEILQANYEGSMADAIKYFEYQQKGQGALFIISDFYNFTDEQFKGIAALSKKHQVFCVRIYDIIEKNAPEAGLYAAEYEGINTIFDSFSDDFRNNYNNFFAQQREFIKKNCQKLSCNYIEICSEAPFFKQFSIK